MDFEQMIERADRASQRIERILNTAFPGEDDESYVMKLSILATMVDCLAIENGKDPVEAKNMIAALGSAIEAIVSAVDSGYPDEMFKEEEP